MDKRFYLPFVFIIFVVSWGYTNAGVYVDDDDDESAWNRCPWIRNKLKNGRVKIRNRGRVAKFLCDPGYELVGKRFASCVRGHWSNPVPMCVARGCFKLPDVQNGHVTEMYRGAVMMYDCNPGYTLEGHNTLYCDGRRWSAVVPDCVLAISNPQLSCDFEDPTLCGWSQDPNHDFDWRRNQFSTPSNHAGTGPSYDHTFGPGKGGYYLYQEASSPRKPNDLSRLFSPVYYMDQSGGCFFFWYHMYGSDIGGLKVYIKPESHVLGEIAPAWDLYGNQGDIWLRGNVSVPNFSEYFQIIIEGIRGYNYIADTAIDDVYLSTLDCDEAGNSTEQLPELRSNSCRGRCREEINSTYCGCNDDCHANGNCCFDFMTICTGSYESTENPSEEQEHNNTVLSTSSSSSSESQISMTSNVLSSTLSTITAITELNSSSFINPGETSTLYRPSSYSETMTSTSYYSAPTQFSSTRTSIEDLPVTPSQNLTSSVETKLNTTPATTKQTVSSTLVPTTISAILTASTIVSSTTETSPYIFNTTAIRFMTTPTTTTPSTTVSTTSRMSSYNFNTTSTRSVTTPSITTQSMIVPSTSTTAGLNNQTEKPIFSMLPNYSSTSMLEVSSTNNLNTRSTLPEISSSTSTHSPSTIFLSTETPTTQTTTFVSTLSTRKTYNLRPRNRTIFSTSTTTVYPFIQIRTRPYPSRSYTRFLNPTYSTSTLRYETIPYSRWHFLTSTTKNPSFRFPTTTHRLTTSRSEPTTPTEETSSFETFLSNQIPPETKSEIIDDHASKSASRANNEFSSAPIFVTLIIIGFVVAVGVYLIRRRKLKNQTKLSDDSEMRFLSENEVVDYSDPTALDKMLVH